MHVGRTQTFNPLQHPSGDLNKAAANYAVGRKGQARYLGLGITRVGMVFKVLDLEETMRIAASSNKSNILLAPRCKCSQVDPSQPEPTQIEGNALVG